MHQAQDIHVSIAVQWEEIVAEMIFFALTSELKLCNLKGPFIFQHCSWFTLLLLKGTTIREN